MSGANATSAPMRPVGAPDSVLTHKLTVKAILGGEVANEVFPKHTVERVVGEGPLGPPPCGRGGSHKRRHQEDEQGPPVRGGGDQAREGTHGECERGSGCLTKFWD